MSSSEGSNHSPTDNVKAVDHVQDGATSPSVDLGRPIVVTSSAAVSDSSSTNVPGQKKPTNDPKLDDSIEVINSAITTNAISTPVDDSTAHKHHSPPKFNAHSRTHRSNTLPNRDRSYTLTHQSQPTRKYSLRRSNTIEDGQSPPPIPAPGDIIAVLDPASVGGGGPLKRIETARSEREAQERLDREAQGLSTENNNNQGILKKFRTYSNTSSRRRPTFITPLPTHTSSHNDSDHEHEEEEDDNQIQHHGIFSHYRLKKHKPTLTPMHSHSHSRKSSIIDTPVITSVEDNEKQDGYFPSGSRTSDEKNGQHQSKEEVESQRRLEFEEHVYPDGGYGWIVLICCVVLAGCTMGWNMNYGVFQEYYATNIFPTTKSAILVLPGCFNGFFMNFSAFLSGRMGDRYGFKRVLYASASIFWLGLFLASWSTKLWQLALTQGVIAGFGQGLALPLFMSLPSQWFYKRRGLASGIAIGGAGLGGGTITLVARQLLTAVGYKKTLLILSFVELVSMLIAAFFLRTRPTSPEARSGKTAPWVDRNVVKTGAFWSIMIGTVVGTTGYAMPYNFLSQYTKANFTINDPILLALPTTLLAYMVCVGRALVGFVADQIGPLNTYILVFFCSGIIQFALWLTAKSFGGVLAFAIMFGLIAPGFSGILPQIIVQLFGPANLATNVGLILLSGAPGNLINGPIGGGIYDATGRTTFKYTIMFGGAMQIAGAILACYARYKTSKKFIVKV
ncbi:uncharacterized protein L201_005061 [Kwoniella dendrophila CBS 6074]|uniref:Major facilitator superfamily (MFS) profile domain-containing protein n=1 Tax=Kwoniella dendrophila CBS 6074 TaxID=1295534 RepID=A0AAX4JZ41_9TREE